MHIQHGAAGVPRYHSVWLSGQIQKRALPLKALLEGADGVKQKIRRERIKKPSLFWKLKNAEKAVLLQTVYGHALIT